MVMVMTMTMTMMMMMMVVVVAIVSSLGTLLLGLLSPMRSLASLFNSVVLGSRFKSAFRRFGAFDFMKPLSLRACLEHTGKICWSMAWGRVLFCICRNLAFTLYHLATLARAAMARNSNLVSGWLGQASVMFTLESLVQE